MSVQASALRRWSLQFYRNRTQGKGGAYKFIPGICTGVYDTGCGVYLDPDTQDLPLQNTIPFLTRRKSGAILKLEITNI
jgi:hypothetical protein